MAPRIEQRTGFHHLVSPARWQGQRPRLSAGGGATSTRAGARLRDMRKRGSRRRTCIVFFFFCFSASSVHEHRSAKLGFPQAKVANGVCERRDRRSHLSEIAPGNFCHAGVCIIPRPALARRLGLQIVVEAPNDCLPSERLAVGCRGNAAELCAVLIKLVQSYSRRLPAQERRR